MSEGIYRGVPPAKLNTDGTPLVDWSITGAAGGVGKLGKNYLKQKTTPIANGCIGTFTGNITRGDALTGYTFNTGNNTKIYGIFSYPNGGDGNVISPANMGNLMMVEGTTIPSAYDADTNLCKEPIYQGTVYFQNYDNGSVVGTSQMFFVGQDQYGRTNTFIDSYWTDRRTHIGPITVKPNTDYSVRLFGCSYPTISLFLGGVTAPGTITPTFTRLWNQKTIPTNEAFGDAETATEQWIDLAYQYYDSLRARVHMPIDLRPIRYEFCESFAELKAGTYKLMIDEWGNYDLDNDWVGFSPCSGCYEDNWDGQQTNVYEWFALVKEDNTPVIPKTSLFDASMQSYENRRSKTSPFPNYFHKEFTFTLTEDTNVGVIHKAYYNSRTYTYPPYFRFYIVDADEEAESFTTTGCSPTNMTGYSAWEKYQVTLPVMVSCADQSQIITFDLNDFLYSGDTISKSSTGIDIPTYVGITDISLMCEVAPTEMYIRYHKGSIGTYCTICGYGGESKAVCPRCGATGYDLLDIPAMAQGSMYVPDELDLVRDEIGFTNPNLHRRAPDDLHIDGTYASINYPSSVPASYSDIETTTEDDVMKISKYKGTETNICIPEVYVSAGVTTIGLGAFTDTDVVYVEIPDGITTIE